MRTYGENIENLLRPTKIRQVCIVRGRVLNVGVRENAIASGRRRVIRQAVRAAAGPASAIFVEAAEKKIMIVDGGGPKWFNHLVDAPGRAMARNTLLWRTSARESQSASKESQCDCSLLC